MSNLNKPLGVPTFIQLCCQNCGYVENRIKDHMSAKEWRKIESSFKRTKHLKHQRKIGL